MPDIPLSLSGSAGGSGGFGGFGGVQTAQPWWQQALGVAIDVYRGNQGGGGYAGGDPLDDMSPMTQSDSLFLRQTMTGWRAAGGVVVLPTPDNRLTFWRSLGKPMLWSGDMAAVKRVKRAAGKASSRVGLRRGKR